MLQLVGHYSSPFVRRTAVTAKFLGIDLQHRKLSVFSDYDEFRALQPLVKVPTLVCDDGSLLVDSTLIIDYLESISDSVVCLMPEDPADRLKALQYIGVALAAGEKGAQRVYESTQRPAEKIHEPWLNRLGEQLEAAVAAMEAIVGNVNPWIFGEQITQADITIASVWRFVSSNDATGIEADRFPALSAFSRRAEELPEFRAIQP